LRTNEEDGLEGIFRVVSVAQDAAADPEHHRPVSVHEGLERGGVMPLHEARQQMGVG
jgi:hypothetical protein